MAEAAATAGRQIDSVVGGTVGMLAALKSLSRAIRMDLGLGVDCQ